MASTSETGHGVNVENGKKVVGILTTIGGNYAPANKKLATKEVEAKVLACDGKAGALVTPQKLLNDAKVERQKEYVDLDETVDLVINNLEASDGVSKKTISSVKAIAKKIKGNSSSKKNGGKGAKTAGADPAAPDDSSNSISTSQKSFDMRFTNFKKLVGMVKAEANYATNEPKAQLANLDKKVAALEAVNKKVKPLEVTVKKGLEARDIELYYPGTGLLDLIKKVKKTVNGSTAITDAEKEEINNLKFKMPSKNKLHFEWPKEL